jgi:riboflavin kinase/FMN adenylyltransferase
VFIVETIKRLDRFHDKLGLTIGNFEGFHPGHREIIRTLVAQSRRRGLYAAVITFKQHPLKILRGVEPERLTLPCDKIISLRKMNIDLLFYLDFSTEFADTDPFDFLKMLNDKLSPKLYCLGSGFRFGRKNRGDIDFLQKNGKRFKYDLQIVDDIMYDSSPVSSTRIRDAVKSGDVALASALLGRDYYLYVKVDAVQSTLKPLCTNCAFPVEGIYGSRLVDVGSGNAVNIFVKREKSGFSLRDGAVLKEDSLYRLVFLEKSS